MKTSFRRRTETFIKYLGIGFVSAVIFYFVAKFTLMLFLPAIVLNPWIIPIITLPLALVQATIHLTCIERMPLVTIWWILKNKYSPSPAPTESLHSKSSSPRTQLLLTSSPSGRRSTSGLNLFDLSEEQGHLIEDRAILSGHNTRRSRSNSQSG